MAPDGRIVYTHMLPRFTAASHFHNFHIEFACRMGKEISLVLYIVHANILMPYAEPVVMNNHITNY
jgi:hypothetical protein